VAFESVCLGPDPRLPQRRRVDNVIGVELSDVGMLSSNRTRQLSVQSSVPSCAGHINPAGGVSALNRTNDYHRAVEDKMYR
jgi:hypothetical protein